MALSFTDENIQNLTKDQILLPLVINDPVNGTGLIQQKATIEATKVNLQKTDAQNKVFSDHFIGIQQAYHNELIPLNNELRTTYNDADLVAGGGGQGPHYPPSYIPMIPSVLDSNNGLPNVSAVSLTEQERIDIIKAEIDLLKNGFIDGADDLLVTSITDTEFEVAAIGTLAVGQNIVIDITNQSLYGSIIGITGTTVEYTKIVGTNGSVLGVGARVKNSHPGFTDSERGHQTVPYAPEFRDYIEGLISAAVNNWESNLGLQKTALESNDDIGVFGTQISDNIVLVDGVLTSIINWESIVVVDINGRFTDVSLAVIEADLSNRELTDIPNRLIEISTALGSVNQISDGTFSGSGRYFDLFSWIDIRIAKSGGSLFSQSSVDLGISFFDQKIVKSNEQLNQYNATFTTVVLTEDSSVGDIEFTVDSVVGLSPLDEVKVMDNDSVVFTRNIDTIVGNVIRLDSGIPVELTVSSLARIVRQK